MEGIYFFERDTLGFDEAWNRLARHVSERLGHDNGRTAAYGSLVGKLRIGVVPLPDESVKRLMRIVLEGVPGNVDRCVMESEVLPGEHWQYMGTTQDQVTRHWYHEFRHRHLDISGGRVDLKFPCTVPVPASVPPVRMTTVHAKPQVGAGFVDDGEAF